MEAPDIILGYFVQFFRKLHAYDLLERILHSHQDCSSLAGAEIDEHEVPVINRQCADGVPEKLWITTTIGRRVQLVRIADIQLYLIDMTGGVYTVLPIEVYFSLRPFPDLSANRWS